MKFSGWPFRHNNRSCRVSPIIGHPVFPGGRFGLGDLCLYKKEKRKMRARDVQISKLGNGERERRSMSVGEYSKLSLS